MQINPLDAHDRLLHLKQEQTINVYQGAEDCLKRNPLSLAYQEKSPYIYVFGHPRTLELDERIKLFKTGKYAHMGEVPSKALFWQPRLSKPKAQTNSYLFRAQSKTDLIEICWIIPPKEQWDQYKKGNVTENDYIVWSIDQFQNNRGRLEEPYPDDVSDARGREILRQIRLEMKQDKKMSILDPFKKI